MKILSMTATFGGLEGQTLTLRDGLNILELPNEGGKSTWSAFLRAMLYGVETRKGRETSEKNRFTPWSGKPMKGSMDVFWQGKAVTLRRFSKGASPFGGFQAVYTGTEEPVPGLTADNVGQTLLGFGREVFERTCFIQGGLGVGPSAELEQRLAALASSGEEDVSYSQTEATLRTWRNAYQSNRANGSIPKLRAQRDALALQSRQLASLEDDCQDAEAQEAQLLRRQTLLQKELDELAARQEKEYRQAYADAQKKLSQATSRLQVDLPLHPLIGGALTVLCGVGLGLLSVRQFLSGLLFLLAGAGVWGLALAFRRRRRRSRQAAVEQARAELDALEHWEPPREETARLQRELDGVTQTLLTLRTRRATAEGHRRAVGDPDELRAQMEDLAAQIAHQQTRYDALTAAMDALAAANARLQLRFAPAVSALAGEILSKLTGGRYDSLSFTRAFEALAGGQGLDAKNAVFLSQGTADQAYLALRLAICLLALPSEDCAPLVLDDALVTFDDSRLALALRVLSDLAVDRQVLLFTCQGRERLAWNGPDVV